jgi:hypothetical protein
MPEDWKGGYDATVRLDAAHESLWLWPDLDPDWFRLRRVRLSGS